MVLLQGAAAGTDIEAGAEAAAGIDTEAGAELVNLNSDGMVGASIFEEIVAVNVGNGYIKSSLSSLRLPFEGTRSF